MAVVYYSYLSTVTIIKDRCYSRCMQNVLKAKAVGRKGTITHGELIIEVEIIKHKNVYGRDRYLITPVAGTGEMWVENVIIKP
jgi:hypothetical protein